MDSPIHKVRRNVGYLTYPRRNGAPEPLCHTSHHPGAHVASPHGRNVTIVSRAADCRSGPASLWSRGRHSVSKALDEMRRAPPFAVPDLGDSAPTLSSVSRENSGTWS